MPGRIPPDIIDRIRESTDIVDLVSGYVKLDKKGGNYFGLCPFHPEKTASFSVHPGKQIFHCFGCGVGGNAFTFLQEHDKLTFAEAARELAQRVGIEIPEEKYDPQRAEKFDALYLANEFACEYYSRCLWEGKGEGYDQVRDYLSSRGISPELAKTFKLGYAPDRWDGLIEGMKKHSKTVPDQGRFIEAGLMQRKEDRVFDRFRGRLMFPILNLSGRPVGFGGRTMKEDEKNAKYINTQQTPIYNKGNLLYGLYFAREQIRRRGECLIVEGYTDLMRLHEGGFTHSVASSGTALTADQARILRRFCRKITLVFDGDAAGSHASLRGGDVLLGEGLDAKVVGLPEGYDPDSFIREKGAGAFGSLLEASHDMISYRIKLYRREGRLSDVPSRSEVARELLATIAIIPDSIKREMTAQEAAKQIGIAPETLLRELGRTRQFRSRGSEEEGESGGLFDSYPVKARGLLEILIRRTELRSAVFSEFTSQDFQHVTLRTIAARLESAFTKGEPLSGEDLITEDTGLEETKFIAYALSQTESLTNPDTDPKAMRRYDDYRVAHDCLRDLVAAKLDKDEERLKAELLKQPEIGRILELQRGIKEINEKRKEVKKQVFWEIPSHPSVDISED